VALKNQSRRRHIGRRGAYALGGAALLLALLLAALASVVPFSSETARVKIASVLADRLDSEVELGALTLRVLPRLRATGESLIVRHEGRHDVPPLISVASLSVEGGVADLLRRHISTVHVEGLQIQIPPGSDDDAAGDSAEPLPASYVIDELVTTGAKLVVLPRDRRKNPKVWSIHDLRMTSVAFDRRMPFEARLTNAIPPGEIAVSGGVGPWRAAEPGRTPLDGTFTFDRADLGVFKGITGILSAKGTFGGRIDEIEVHGETTTPQFALAAIGHAVPLQATYDTIVDATNGNTILRRIDASFRDTSLVARGDVIDVNPGEPGRRVALEVTMDDARLEDILWLAVKAAQPPMTGALSLQTRMEIPPGDQDVVEKMKLDGKFSISGARFASPEVQQKIGELSRRGSGRPRARNAADVASDFTGSFRLANGVLTIPSVAFDVPGAVVRLSGTYGLTSETLDFRGTLFMDARLSETVTGFKSLLLKAVDPLFRGENGGSAIPIRISGRRSNPSFGLDKGRIFRR
jgi:hypothetical protein